VNFFKLIYAQNGCAASDIAALMFFKEEFCDWLFQKENANTTFVAHNFQAYDGYFILQYLYNNGVTPEVITRGAKILSLTVPELNIKFIDSLCFIPMHLTDFPKTFGITELEKGYFPHFFNRAENQSYIGPLPDAKFYDPDGMKPDDREKFYAWYNDLLERDYNFDFQAEILSYCQSDVDILRRCCLELCDLFREVTDIDPFASCLTIASACNLVFRKTFLKENTIAIIPACGYTPENKHSVIARKMLTWIALRDDISIRHARTMVNNGLVNMSSMVSTPRQTRCGRCKAACGMVVDNVSPEIRSIQSII
jgi:hypothetical protein